MKKKAVAIAMSSLLVLSLGTTAFAADSQSSSEIKAKIEGGYTVTIPATIDLGTVSAEDFTLKSFQTSDYGVAEDAYQYMVDADFDIKVDGWYGDNQYVKVTTGKEATLTDSGSDATVPVSVYPYERAFDKADTKTSTVTLYKDDAQPGDFTGTATFDIELVTYDTESGIEKALSYWSFTWDRTMTYYDGDVAKATAAMAELGYDALSYQGNQDEAALKELGLGMAEVQQVTEPADIIAKAAQLKNDGIAFDNFKVTFSADEIDGLAANAENVNANYGPYWETMVQKAVDFNIALKQAADDAGYGEIDFWCTIEKEPMGNAFESPLEIAMFVQDVARRTEDLGYENYVTHCIDLGHTYSYLDLGLGTATTEAAVEYFNTQDWAKALFYNSPYFGTLEVKAPADIYEYMSLCKGYVKCIQFFDNNGSTFMGGKASGSHVGLGKGRIDYMAYMDALCNVAEFDGNYWVYEPWYNESGVDITEDVNEGVMWMTEWNLLYAVDEI